MASGPLNGVRVLESGQISRQYGLKEAPEWRDGPWLTPAPA